MSATRLVLGAISFSNSSHLPPAETLYCGSAPPNHSLLQNRGGGRSAAPCGARECAHSTNLTPTRHGDHKSSGKGVLSGGIGTLGLKRPPGAIGASTEPALRTAVTRQKARRGGQGATYVDHRRSEDFRSDPRSPTSSA